jgi:hypothetical protein
MNGDELEPIKIVDENGEEFIVEESGKEKYANYNFETGEFETNIEGLTLEMYLELLGPSVVDIMKGEKDE